MQVAVVGSGRMAGIGPQALGPLRATSQTVGLQAS